MRINIYEGEMTEDIQLITKDNVIDEDGNLTTFFGVRFFLESSDKMHQTEFDDDRSAITFWFKDQTVVFNAFKEALYKLGDTRNE